MHRSSLAWKALEGLPRIARVRAWPGSSSGWQQQPVEGAWDLRQHQPSLSLRHGRGVLLQDWRATQRRSGETGEPEVSNPK